MRSVLRVGLALVVVGCGSAAPSPSLTPSATGTPPIPTAPVRTPTPTERPSPTPTATPAAFPTGLFAAIDPGPVPADLATELQAILEDLPSASLDVAGVSATLMSARGTWSGVKGTADGARAVTIDTQFSIASTTKAITAVQVMQLVEAGVLGLDDLVADHLPAGLDFDTNGATIRHLLSHRSGIPDYADAVHTRFEADPRRFWTPAEILAEVPAARKPAGGASEYGNVNYLLLGVVVETVTGRPYVEVLRDGVLVMDGLERLIFQPDEKPTAPIAFDDGRSAEWFESVGGFVPSLALTSDGAAAAMASDSISLATWWRALCAGEIISQASLTAMIPTVRDSVGLGLFRFRDGTIGHFGSDPGGVSLAGCAPETGVVYSVLFNRGTVDPDRIQPLIRAIGAP